MKKAVVTAGLCLALGVFLYVGSSSGQAPNNQTTASPSATPTGTRIAIMNLTYVVQKYVKFQRYKEEMKAVVEPFTKTHNDLQQQLDALRKKAAELPRQGAGAQGDEIERQGREIQRKMEDNKSEVSLVMNKRSDESMKIIYQDVALAVQGYAVSHRFDLVLHYNDAITQEDFMSAQNIARKLNTGALMPLYQAQNQKLDISQDIVELLNSGMGGTPGGAPQGVQPTGGQR